MALYPLFVFLMGLCVFHGSVYCQIKTEDSAENPFKSLCSRKCESPKETSNEEDFPFYQCSCSESCSMYGDCCYDSKYKNGKHNVNFVCLSLFGHGKYQAVYGCPSNKEAESCKSGLGHLPPVTSRKTNTTYANIYCASCNGDAEDLVTWNVDLSCPSKFTEEIEKQSNDEIRFVTRFGDIWMLNESSGYKRFCLYRVHFNDTSFLEGLELRPCSNARKISRCSSSWHDAVTVQMCRSYEDPVYFHNTLYKNIHCAACNYLNPEYATCMPFYMKIKIQRGFIDSKIHRFCRTRGSEACIETLSNRHRGKQYSFADLLNIREKECVPPAGRRCCEGQSFDFRVQRCRKMVRG